MPRRGFDDLPGKSGMLLLERSYGGFVFPQAQLVNKSYSDLQ
jgi:hypothetical protein